VSTDGLGTGPWSARRVIVVGAGVVGLSCAVRLLEDGHRVDVVARDLPRETTSAVAAALWYPYLAEPRERVLGWATRTYAALAEIAAADPDAGVRLREGTELRREAARAPWWAAAVPAYSRAGSLPPGYATGWSLAVPVVETPVYLGWLTARLEALGGTLTRLNLSALPPGAPDTVVVDCSGLGARLLGADRSVTPVAGQVVVVEQVGLDRWTLAEDDRGPIYVVPRSRDVVVGGTEDHGEWSRTPSPATAEAILARATALVPELGGARVRQHRVGLRPARPEVRLEHDPVRPDVVHCYGHGGAGVTLSWGCAEEVARLVGPVGRHVGRHARGS